MLFTVIISVTLMGCAIFITNVLNSSFAYMKEFFGTSFGFRTNIFLLATDDVLEAFCPEEIMHLESEYKVITILYLVILVNTIGMFTSLSQKIIIFRNKDNVTLNLG